MISHDQLHAAELGCAELRALAEGPPADASAAPREVVINPEWLALNGRPHFVLAVSAGAYDTIQVGPVPNMP